MLTPVMASTDIEHPFKDWEPDFLELVDETTDEVEITFIFTDTTDEQ